MVKLNKGLVGLVLGVALGITVPRTKADLAYKFVFFDSNGNQIGDSSTTNNLVTNSNYSAGLILDTTSEPYTSVGGIQWSTTVPTNKVSVTGDFMIIVIQMIFFIRSVWIIVIQILIM